MTSSRNVLTLVAQFDSSVVSPLTRGWGSPALVMLVFAQQDVSWRGPEKDVKSRVTARQLPGPSKKGHQRHAETKVGTD